MERDHLLAWWNEAWTSGLWAAPWPKLVDDLLPSQAAWTPAAARHSIWQIVEHVIFWREVALQRSAGGGGPSDGHVARRNFPHPTEPSATEWESTRRRFAESQQRVAAALADPARDAETLRNLLPHDAYHLGQVAYVRALQGLPPAE